MKNHNSRRNFLKKAALLSIGGTGAHNLLGTLNLAHAQTQPFNDYRALVCVFLLGGNDAFNTVVPRSTAEYNTYAATRQTLAVEQNQLLPINPIASAGADYGLHPNMPEVQNLFENSNLSIIGNVGALIEPVTQQDYINNAVAIPPQLFSHNDQQNFVMSLEATKPQQGWASRIADALVDANINQQLSQNITLTGANTWQAGGDNLPYSLTSQGVPTLFGIDANSSDELTLSRTAAFQALQQLDNPHLFVDEYARVQTRSETIGSQVAAALDAQSDLTTVFDNTSRLAQSLRMVARLIAAKNALGMSRQMFFVGMGGYDTHGDQLNAHPGLLSELSQSLNSFYQATVELGVENDVTTFTASDFGRTLTSNGDGTDHGWGTHQFVMGGSVVGRQIIGTMPDLAIGSSDDIGEGRIIPTTAMDQYSATLAEWYGMTPAQIANTFPNLVNFNQSNLGFMSS